MARDGPGRAPGFLAGECFPPRRFQHQVAVCPGCARASGPLPAPRLGKRDGDHSGPRGHDGILPDRFLSLNLDHRKSFPSPHIYAGKGENSLSYRQEDCWCDLQHDLPTSTLRNQRKPRTIQAALWFIVFSSENFDPSAVAIVRYRYRGAAIPSPWVTQTRSTAYPTDMNRWRAGCGASRKSGSEGGPEKPTDRKVSRALRSDPTIPTDHTSVDRSVTLTLPNVRDA